MGLSIYKSDIDTISDNINIINYKQKNIENVINTINNSVNTLKANCYGTTVSVMCFKLNNLKQQIESVNEYLTKYKQESQQVVDLYYQHCDGLNLDEDTLRNNISILNNKIDIYNNLSKPNKRLVNNATLQLERNLELLDGLYYVSDNTETKLEPDQNHQLVSNNNVPSLSTVADNFLSTLDALLTILVVATRELDCYDKFKSGSALDLENLKVYSGTLKTFTIVGFFSTAIIDFFTYDFYNNTVGSTLKLTTDLVQTGLCMVCADLVAEASDAGVSYLLFNVASSVSWIFPAGTIVGTVLGIAAGIGLAYAMNNDIFNTGSSFMDDIHSACDWVGSWFK